MAATKKKMATKKTPKSTQGPTKRMIGEITVAIEPAGRGLKGSIYYEGGPFPMKDDERVLKEVKGKTEEDVMKLANDWVAKRTPNKILICCARCKNGVELTKTMKNAAMEIYCGACGAVVYRGVPISWQS